MGQLKLGEKVSDYLSETLEQAKKDQQFVKELSEIIKVANPTADTRKDIKHTIQSMNKEL